MQKASNLKGYRGQGFLDTQHSLFPHMTGDRFTGLQFFFFPGEVCHSFEFWLCIALRGFCDSFQKEVCLRCRMFFGSWIGPRNPGMQSIGSCIPWIPCFGAKSDGRRKKTFRLRGTSQEQISLTGESEALEAQREFLVDSKVVPKECCALVGSRFTT